MSIELNKWDAAEHIRDERYARLFLEESAKDGDPAEIADALSNIARAYGMVQLAKQAGLPVERFFAALNRTPGPDRDELLGLVEALGVDTKTQSSAAE